MAASIASAFADISLAQLALIAGMALIASVIGGVAGYGTGALMPLVLVPIVGAEPVVPIIAMSALLTNTGRIAAYRRLIDLRRALIGGVALPGAFLARTLVNRMPVHVHTAILDAVVIGGGAVMVTNAFTR